MKMMIMKLMPMLLLLLLATSTAVINGQKATVRMLGGERYVATTSNVFNSFHSSNGERELKFSMEEVSPLFVMSSRTMQKTSK